ncbi:hypothetical protein F5Y19DRAFT_475757 [Xylariaceae sp. FL1651]|nr:hypothetical protein F5Y19DRAFT_475757 [Xylariaceae sp. FL1651]
MSSSTASQSAAAAAVAGPVLRRGDTGCAVTLGAGVIPLKTTHSATKCKCIPAKSDEEIGRLAESLKKAMEEGILESEKPAIAFAMLLLGGDVVYEVQEGQSTELEKAAEITKEDELSV